MSTTTTEEPIADLGTNADRSCDLCETVYTAKHYASLRMFYPRHCPECTKKREDETKAEAERIRMIRRNQAWRDATDGFERISNSDEGRLPMALVSKAKSWDWSGGRGLMFAANKAGLGKSRCAFIALERAFEAGKRCFAIAAVRLERLATRGIYDDDKAARSNAEDKLERCRECSVLLLDDIDKPKWTPASEKELFELLDTRHAAMRPTIWTSNTLRADLGALWSEERRAAILRRLTDETDIAEVKL